MGRGVESGASLKLNPGIIYSGAIILIFLQRFKHDEHCNRHLKVYKIPFIFILPHFPYPLLCLASKGAYPGWELSLLRGETLNYSVYLQKGSLHKHTQALYSDCSHLDA